MSAGAVPVVMTAALAGVFGLVIGSFLNVVICRVPAGESVVRPASRCPHCATPLRPWQNVPVVSWLALRGRCASCSAPIALRYPLVEVATAVLFVALSLRLHLSVLPAYLFFGALGVALSVIDLDHHRLPDRMVLPAYPVLGVLLAAASAVDGDWSAFTRATVAALAAFCAFYAIAFAWPGAMGYGDVKLAGLVGAVLGYLSWPALVVGLFGSFAFGAAAGVVLMALGRAGRRNALAFGPFLILGATVAILAGGAIGDSYLHLLRA